MIKREWKSGPIHLKQPLRHCSKIVSARPAKRTFITAVSADSLSRFSKIPPIVTSDKIAKEVETTLSLSLINATDQISIFNCYRNAFSLMIERFRSEGKSMKLIKEGYDRIINQLLEGEKRQKKQRLIRRRSVLNITALTNEEKTKANIKFDRLIERLTMIRNIRDDLRKEVEELQNQVRSLRNENDQTELSIGSKRNYIEEVNEDLDVILSRKQGVEEKLQKRQCKLSNLDGKLEQKVQITSDVLNDIYRLDKELRQSVTDIENLKGRIETIRNLEAETKATLREVSDERDALKDELEALKREVIALEESSSTAPKRGERAKKHT